MRWEQLRQNAPVSIPLRLSEITSGLLSEIHMLVCQFPSLGNYFTLKMRR